MILRAITRNWRNSAHRSTERETPFAGALGSVKVKVELGQRSHLRNALSFNYRYPSPSLWSGPNFRIRPELPAIRQRAAVHDSRDAGNFAFVSRSKHNKIDAGHKKGSEIWTTGKLAWRLLAPHCWRVASLTKVNASLSAQQRAPSSRTLLATMLLSAQPRVVSQAQFATTSTSATRNTRGAGLTRARPLTANRTTRFASLTPDIPTHPHRAGACLASRGLACR